MVDSPYHQWLAPLLQCNDSAYPVGSFAHSFGLEGMVQSGGVKDRETLAAFLDGPIRHGLTNIDLPLLAQAFAASGEGDREKLIELDEISAACRVPSELREAASRVGRQRLGMIDSVWSKRGGMPDPMLPHSQSPVVAGIEAQRLGAPCDAAMFAYAHGAFAAVISASVKLLRLGQTAVQQMLAESSRSISQMVYEAKALPLEDLGSFAPLCDTSSMRHERSRARMFLS